MRLSPESSILGLTPLARSLALGIIVALACVAAPRAGTAQEQTQTVSLASGPTIARKPFADTVGSGFHVTAAIGFNFGERFALRMEAMYQQLAARGSQVRDHQMVGLGSAAELNLLGRTGPYLVGGYGFYQTLKSGTVPASSWEGGYNVGGGMRLFFPRLSLFGEVRLHRVRGEGRPAMVPLSVGIRI